MRICRVDWWGSSRAPRDSPWTWPPCSRGRFHLLLTTVIVVAVLLLVTYRSPWLWLVPLVVVGLADGIAGIVATRVAAAAGIPLDASVTGILSVLVFGAGTNYALLLIARYRDELRVIEDRRVAMAAALRGAGPAIIASGSTVVLSLLTLVFAQLEGNRALGIACATGVVIAMLFALWVLPAALVLFGRGLFWPYVPKFGSEGSAERGVWHRLGLLVSRKPVAVAIAGAVLGGLASPAFRRSDRPGPDRDSPPFPRPYLARRSSLTPSRPVAVRRCT